MSGLIPVRCFTCGKVIGNIYERFRELICDGLSPEEALNTLNLRRICCRRMLLGHVELFSQIN